MVTKGIITELVGTTQAKVRIPIYDKAKTAIDATPDSELSTAVICTFPGGSPSYNVGDVVIIGFEQDIFTKPVILGQLYVSTSSQSFTSMQVNKLSVITAASLPKNTLIGGEAIATVNYVDSVVSGGGGGGGDTVITFTPDGVTHNLIISEQSASSIPNGNVESY